MRHEHKKPGFKRGIDTVDSDVTADKVKPATAEYMDN